MSLSSIQWFSTDTHGTLEWNYTWRHRTYFIIIHISLEGYLLHVFHRSLLSLISTTCRLSTILSCAIAVLCQTHQVANCSTRTSSGKTYEYVVCTDEVLDNHLLLGSKLSIAHLACYFSKHSLHLRCSNTVDTRKAAHPNFHDRWWAHGDSNSHCTIFALWFVTIHVCLRHTTQGYIEHFHTNVWARFVMSM